MIIGYTTGVFDMFHVGHLNILRQAKENCDYLIVGISTDELVEKEKGHKTVIPFNDRCEIIKSVRFVDEVVPQIDKNKFAAWQKYHFDKMFVGSDWKGTEVWNRYEEQFAKVGVQIVYFQYTDRISSTMLRAIINGNETQEKKEEKI